MAAGDLEASGMACSMFTMVVWKNLDEGGRDGEIDGKLGLTYDNNNEEE